MAAVSASRNSNPAVHIRALQPLQRGDQQVKGFSRPHIVHQRHPVIMSVGRRCRNRQTSPSSPPGDYPRCSIRCPPKYEAARLLPLPLIPVMIKQFHGFVLRQFTNAYLRLQRHAVSAPSPAAVPPPSAPAHRRRWRRPRLMTKPACFSDTCAPPTVRPLQPALLDQTAREVALRPLEGTARTGILQRLRRPAAGHQVIHAAAGWRRCRPFARANSAWSTTAPGCSISRLWR